MFWPQDVPIKFKEVSAAADSEMSQWQEIIAGLKERREKRWGTSKTK